MKKILGLSIAAILLIATVSLGTMAYFSDEASSESNVIMAGTLDLTINDANDNVNILVNLENEAPGNTGNLFATLRNAGSLEGELDIYTSEVVNVGGSGGTEWEDGIGHLGGVAEIAMWIDVDQNGNWSDGDIGLKSDGTLYLHPTALQYSTVNSYSNKNWGGSDGIMRMPPVTGSGNEIRFHISYRIPTSAGNEIQGDYFSFGVYFVLEQPAAD